MGLEIKTNEKGLYQLESTISGEREVAEDKIIEEICQKYGYTLSEYYATNAKNLK